MDYILKRYFGYNLRMKPSSSILATIFHRPEFKKLNRGYCYTKFIALLQPKFQKAIAFVYIKNATLFIALSHPGFKMELGYHIQTFQTIFQMLIANDKQCGDLVVQKVVIFNSNKISIVQKDETQTQTVPYYSELAKGDFKIETQDTQLLEKFQAIKKSIAKNWVIIANKE